MKEGGQLIEVVRSRYMSLPEIVQAFIVCAPDNRTMISGPTHNLGCQ